MVEVRAGSESAESELTSGRRRPPGAGARRGGRPGGRADRREAALAEIERRVLWLAVRMVDAANRERPHDDGVKVGGHQASSSSLVSIMTALYFDFLEAEDRVSVKPHAAPVLHAINYLLGGLERRYLTTLRGFGGLQAYPSRTKDPDRVDFSTGSVGHGAVAPLFAALTRRYVEHHFSDDSPDSASPDSASPDSGLPGPGGGRLRRDRRRSGRFVAVVGDAELDEGNVWEAVLEPATAGLDRVLWVVDLNRQSLDRVVPGVRAARLERWFADAGWQVLEAKYGRRLQAIFATAGGAELRARIDQMANEEYQALLLAAPGECRRRLVSGAPPAARPAIRRALAGVADAELRPLLADLGGHDLAELRRVLTLADADHRRPSVVFAYTVKGYGLPIAGDPLNHSALLTPAEIDRLRETTGLTPEAEWDLLDPATPAGAVAAEAARRLGVGVVSTRRPTPGVTERARRLARQVPDDLGLEVPVDRPVSTQEAFGRLLPALGRLEGVGERVVTVSPDVAVSTNLGGWINRVGVFAPEPERDYFGGARLLRWQPSPAGRHIELGISEMNLFALLGQLGLAAEISSEPLVPIGTVYDPFVCRGLDALVYAAYSGARGILVGTPSGVSLAPEGGAHQSTITASIGIELPGVLLVEPAYAGELSAWLAAGVRAVLDPDRPAEILYLRLSTRPIDQAPFAAARRRLGPELGRQILAGGYRLIEPDRGPADVVLVASGAVVSEVCRAASLLAEEGLAASVVNVTSPSLLYRAWRGESRRAVGASAPRWPAPGVLSELFPREEGRAPVVSVHDASGHALGFLGGALGRPSVALGVDDFGQSGSVDDLYRAHGLTAEAVVTAAIAAVDGAGRSTPPR